MHTQLSSGTREPSPMPYLNVCSPETQDLLMYFADSFAMRQSLASGLSSKRDSNQFPQLQKIARIMKFRL